MRTVLLSLMFCSAALAQTTPVPPPAMEGISPGIAPGPSTLIHAQSFSTLDTNGDGVIDPAEATARFTLSTDFDTVDANKDGAVDDSEFAVFESDGGIVSP